MVLEVAAVMVLFLFGYGRAVDSEVVVGVGRRECFFC